MSNPTIVTRRCKLDNAELQKEIIKGRECGLSYQLCADKIGIDLKTLEAYRKRNQKFEAKLQIARGNGVTQVLEKLHKVASGGTKSSMAMVKAQELWLTATVPEMMKQSDEVRHVTFNTLIVNETEQAQQRILDAIRTDKSDSS